MDVSSFVFHSPFRMDVVARALRLGEWPLLAYLDQLAAHFAAREPGVLAFVPEEGRFQRLRREARHLLAQYPDPAQRPLLFGLPVGVKDIFHAAGFTTRAGSRLPPALLQGTEAETVRRLRAAGALILGKTVTTEFAYFAPGPTRNPHQPAHTPGGSSSGSAAAVGAGLCLLALGTQTIGSITRPAAFCGVVGYKPSYERISRAGVVPLAPSVDHVGFFTPDVAGARLAARVLVADWRPAAEAVVRRPVLGIPEGPYLQRPSPAALAHFGESVARLGAAGYSIQRVAVMPDFDAICRRHHDLVAAEAAQVHADWFARFAPLYHPKTADLIRRGQAVPAEALSLALAGRVALRAQLTAVMESAGIDLWLSPAAVGSALPGLDSTGDPVLNLPWTHSGLPTLALPTGFDEQGLPWGLQLAGRWQADERLLAWGEQIEDALPVTAARL